MATAFTSVVEGIRSLNGPARREYLFRIYARLPSDYFHLRHQFLPSGLTLSPGLYSPMINPTRLSNCCQSADLYRPEGLLHLLRIPAALTMMIGVGVVSMMIFVASNPSIFGMLISIVTTSGLLSLTALMASSPLPAVPMTEMAGSEERM